MRREKFWTQPASFETTAKDPVFISEECCWPEDGGGVKFPTLGNLNEIFILTRAVTHQNMCQTVKMPKCIPITLHFVMNKYFQIVTMSYDLPLSH